MNLIVATDRCWGIGKDGGLLCHLSGDLKFFKKTTMGHTVVMGRATLESLPGGRGLPGRRNVVLTRQEGFRAENVDDVVHSVEELLALLADDPGAFVIGGADVYRQMLPYCDTCYVTRIEDVFPADRFFPDLDALGAFEITWESDWQEENGLRYRWLKYERTEK
jgi:dihydrofolate reductase